MKQIGAGLAFSLLAAHVAQAATPTPEEMWEIIQKQQAQIEALEKKLADADRRLEQTDVKVEATADMVEEQVAAGAGGSGGLGNKTTLGGYAELHYNNLDNNRDGGNDKDQLDLHRFVLFLGHEFSEKTRFYSELEVEHALVEGGEDSGEVELEQAYIEHDLGAHTRGKAGVFLLPVGLLNETHEPDTFYGVERNNVESRIIPTTWWEGGLALSGEFAPGLSYDAAFTSGLKLDAEEGQWSIRSGRQKVAEADASDPAYTARLKYTGIAGLEVAASLQYQQDLYQGQLNDEVDAVLYEAHIAYQGGPFGLRALWASWDIDDGINDFRTGADEQTGWYVEPSWRPLKNLGFFARYSEWDNQAGGGGDTEYNQWDVGVNYWLEETVVFKLDYQVQEAPDGSDEYEGFNLGVGWSF
ncbi:porin [Mangrovimicrobium sediminis]|uniref:Porin n=1 Tax=Mangrovimicrobium sediminis TaxID=2562682 RepID=A0A4Z0LYC3_9GAMM|nr:porin [Haliea sp. SAOS-164]TGD72138.1 porin [Haliea sp. SAOS-164]